jgi:hypothetical protein
LKRWRPRLSTRLLTRAARVLQLSERSSRPLGPSFQKRTHRAQQARAVRSTTRAGGQ